MTTTRPNVDELDATHDETGGSPVRARGVTASGNDGLGIVYRKTTAANDQTGWAPT